MNYEDTQLTIWRVIFSLAIGLVWFLIVFVLLAL